MVSALVICECNLSKLHEILQDEHVELVSKSLNMNIELSTNQRKWILDTVDSDIADIREQLNRINNSL